ncbi:MAG: fluoride efflux transporter CrcB [Prevotellaceae bacterium]|jgi:CrcB protein|nr:fluoride efflux transporter CrcB [Prevotellaceae bacterium]
MLKNLFLIFLGGGAGSVLRYWLQQLVQKQSHSIFPLGVLAVNVLGSFLIGIAFALLADRQEHFMRFLFIVGFCGGFTTFSSFSIDNFVLLKEAHYLMFALNVLANVALCLGATLLGVWAFKGANI